jgi:hypothetical protein
MSLKVKARPGMAGCPKIRSPKVERRKKTGSIEGQPLNATKEEKKRMTDQSQAGPRSGRTFSNDCSERK